MSGGSQISEICTRQFEVDLSVKILKVIRNNLYAAKFSFFFQEFVSTLASSASLISSLIPIYKKEKICVTIQGNMCKEPKGFIPVDLMAKFPFSNCKSTSSDYQLLFSKTYF